MDEYRGAIFGLGEMMNLPGVYGADEETCHRIAVGAQTVSGQVDGHAPMTAGNDLNAYAAAGIIADHENTGVEEALDELSRGMYVMLREGTCSHDLAALAPLILGNPALARRCCFATDDRAPSDALNVGMIDNACRMPRSRPASTRWSPSPWPRSPPRTSSASTMATCARRSAAAPSPRASAPTSLLLDDLAFTAAPHRVYSAGELVAEDGAFVGTVAPAASRPGLEGLEERLRGSVKLPELDLDVFSYEFRPGEPVIDVTPGNAVTGMARPETAEGLRRIMLIERHGRGVEAQSAGIDGDGAPGTGLVGRHIGRGWVRGFTITGGAIASSIGHDSHNVCVVGDNPCRHVRRRARGGGRAASSSCAMARSSPRSTCPLGGLMSDKTAEEVAREHDAFMEAGRAMGIEPPLDPIMGMIFLPLPVIPTLRIRPEGMFDVTTFAYAE